MTQAFTEANFLALIRSAEGTPYLFGGVNPFDGGADCSGLIFWAAELCGVTLPRTTEAEWADLPHFPMTTPMPVGACVEFEVPGDGGSPPQHVGVNIGGGYMIDDPHTGTVVSVQAIPAIPGVIWPIGWVALPFVAAPVNPPVNPPIQQEGDMSWFATDPKTGGVWATDPNGDLYPTGGAPFVAALSSHPNYHAGSAESGGANPCVGMAYWAAFGNDGVMFFTQPPAGEGGWDGTTKVGAVPYDIYRFLRNGSPA